MTSRDSIRRTKRVLLSLIVLGLLGSATVRGTYAAFNADGQYETNSISTGTLTFTNTVDTGSACYSFGGPSSPANSNQNCDAVFTYSAAAENYPGTPAVASIAITVTGSLNASALTVYMGGCAKTKTPDAPAEGGVDPCGAGGLLFYLQETDSGGNPTTCWFPSGFTTCPFQTDSLSTFLAQHGAVTVPLALGAGPTSTHTRNFKIGMEVPTTASNCLQGEAATFPLTWHMTS